MNRNTWSIQYCSDVFGMTGSFNFLVWKIRVSVHVVKYINYLSQTTRFVYERKDDDFANSSAQGVRVESAAHLCRFFDAPNGIRVDVTRQLCGWNPVDCNLADHVECTSKV